MDFKTFSTGKDDEGRRLDRVVRRFLPDENLSKLYKSIRNGLVKVNQKKIKPEYRIQENDQISICEILLSKNLTSKNENDSKNKIKQNFVAFSQENILFKNEHVLIINKPYDINVQGNNSLAEQIAILWKQEEHQSESLSFIPGPLHRLDKKTTGVLVFSQSLLGAQWFSQIFANHTIKKTYVALLQGKLEKKEQWNDYISKNDNQDKLSFHTVSISSTDSGKEAITEATPLSYGKFNNTFVTLAKITIKTGRTHQIRSQSAFHGYPLLGDTAYGGIKITENQDFFLHAYQLELPKNNPLGIPEKINAFISTNFEKMLSKTLINSECLHII